MPGEASDATSDHEPSPGVEVDAEVIAAATPETALAAYGSLRPGEPNHWVVNRIAGKWIPGTVRGWIFELTFGPAEGYDGFVPDADGSEVAVDVLVGPDVAKRWREIDDFEGPGYERRPIEVELTDGSTITASIYVALTEAE